MRRLLGWVLFFQMARVVSAGLGEDGDKIEDAYGGPKSRRLRDDGTVAVIYQKDRYLYQVVFERGVSVSEEYSRLDGAGLSEKEIAKFLKINGGPKMPWTHTDTAEGRRFERADHMAEGIATRTSLKVRRMK
jgi:hypothetical protein